MLSRELAPAGWCGSDLEQTLVPIPIVFGRFEQTGSRREQVSKKMLQGVYKLRETNI